MFVIIPPCLNQGDTFLDGRPGWIARRRVPGNTQVDARNCKEARTELLLRLGQLSAHSARIVAESVLGTTLGAADLAGSLAGPVARRTTTRISQAARVPGTVSSALTGLGDVGLHRATRRTWSHEGRAHIEVKGLTGRGEQHRRLGADVAAALNEIKGVRWAEINAVTQHVLVAFDEDAVDVDLLVETIESVEEDHGTAEETFSRSAPEHPSADAPATMAAIALAADLFGLGAALVGRIVQAPALPPGVRIPLVFAETYPRVRHTLESRLGRTHAELLLSVSTSTVHALTQGPTPLAVDGLHHLFKFVEVRSRQAVWHRREQELAGDGQGLPSEVEEHLPRPVAFPQGPIERLGDRTALASLVGAGSVLAFTRDPGRAADLMLATMPKAARQGREAFASVLGWELARRGVVPMDGAALRRLDRITAIVVESTVLCTTRPRVLSAVAVGDSPDDASLDDTFDDARVGRIAEQALAQLTALDGAGPWTCGPWRLERAPDAVPGDVDGPHALTLDLLDQAGLRRGRIRIGCELDPLADALLVAARSAVDRVILTGHDSAGELLPWADELIPPADHISDHVRRLQAEGHGVLLVSTSHDAALHAADVGVAVLRADEVSWSADLICGPGLYEAWRLLHAVRIARQVSERSTRLAVGGSALGALVATTGNRRPGRSRGLSPVHSAALVAVVGGGISALRLGRLSAPEPVVRCDWHALTAHDAFARLHADRRVDEAETLGQLAAALQVGRDALGVLTQVPVVSRLVVAPAVGAAEMVGAVVEELRDPLTPVLAFGAAASAVVGSQVDALLVGGVMAGNAVISGGQRLRAERALRQLLIGEQISAHRVDSPVGSARSAEDSWLADLSAAPSQPVPADELRVGDVIVLRATDVVPADARLIATADLEVDESSLTGESLPVTKNTAATPGADLAERACMVYEGCTILAGTGYAVVVAVGSATEAGRAAAVAGSAAPPAGIQARLAELTRIALPAAGLGGLAVTGLAALRGAPLRQAVASGVAIAVAAVPEGLPLVATVAQLAAARRLSRRGVLVRSSRTLEALGRVDTLCFDKTGTLTEGRLAVARLAGCDGDLPFDGQAAQYLLRTAARACPHDDGATGRPLAHATDGAVIEAARTYLKPDEGWQLLTELPFETSRGYAASLGMNDAHLTLAVKGAPEVVLGACTTVLTDGKTGETSVRAPMTAARRRAALAAVRRLAGQGLRVLAVAEARPPTAVPAATEGKGGAPDVAALVTGLTLVGFLAIADTPRASAPEAIRRLSGAGVRITMITGDHPDTARAIATELGIPAADQVMTGAQLDALPKREQQNRIAETTVFARVSPEQKVRIVQALQRAGHTVAMTGDGSNDAAAIRLADVGIAMAGRGSASARTAADLVLAEPDPTRIVDALIEGRALWGNVRDAVSILVGGNAGEIAFTVLGTAASGRAPLGTRQLLLVNMLTDMLPALAVALAPAKPGAENVDHLASGPVAALWGPALARDLAVRGGATALGAALAWQCGRMTGRQRRASTMGLGALVGTQLGQTLVTGRHSPLVIATSLASAAVLVAVVETPGVSQFFGCTPLGPVAWSVVAGSSTAATMAAIVAPKILDKFDIATV
jgi:cation-transporting P-type ATPase I